MNKSIVLVMCDILVLSAMSLSSGGFSEMDELDVAKMSAIDFDVVSRVAFEDVQQKLNEAQKNEADAKTAEKAAREAEALAKAQAQESAALEIRARQEAEAARASEAQAKATAEAARKNEAIAKEKAVEAQMREEDAKAAEKAAREAEALAKEQAEKASAQEARAKQEAETARASEAQAKATAETARKNEAIAKEKAIEAQKREEDAKAAEKAAREAEVLAKNQAEMAAAQEARAKKEADAARANEAHAIADAALARQNEANTKGLADKLQAELDEIHARQNALVGNIPQETIWEMTVIVRSQKKKNSESKTVYSPLFTLDGEGFLFFELRSVGAEVYSEIESVTARYDNFSMTGSLYRLQGHDNWLFVKVGNLANKQHIGFGVESLGIDGNIVFYPKQGKFEGDPVKCESDGKGKFLCSNKTENRTWIQQLKREHSVFEGCFLVSTIHGAIGAIARGKSAGGGLLYCEKLTPISMKDLLPITSCNSATSIKGQLE